MRDEQNSMHFTFSDEKFNDDLVFSTHPERPSRSFAKLRSAHPMISRVYLDRGGPNVHDLPPIQSLSTAGSIHSVHQTDIGGFLLFVMKNTSSKTPRRFLGDAGLKIMFGTPRA
jgi:hypothetical protein